MTTLRRLHSASVLAAFCLAATAISPVQAQNGTTGSTGTTGGTGTIAGTETTGSTLGASQAMDSASALAGANSGATLTASQRADFDRLFYVKAAKGNLAEVMTSQLAVQKSKNPQVKQIAQQMVTEHSRAQAELASLMQARGIPIPPTVGVMHTATYEQLQRSKGDKFDQLYLGSQAEAHEETVALYQSALQIVGDPAARAYIGRYLPAVIGHTQMVYASARQVNAPGSSERPTVFPLVALAGMSPMGGTTMSGLNTGHAGVTGGMGMDNRTGGTATGGGTTRGTGTGSGTTGGQ